MTKGIARCAPIVARAMACLEGTLPEWADRETLAGRAILMTAERACGEKWDASEYESRAEASVMECIAAECDEMPIVRGSARCGPAAPARRLAVLRALDHLDDLRLQVLALVVQEGLSVAEAALVLGLPEWRVHQECAQAVGQIRRQVAACEPGPDDVPGWLVKALPSGGMLS